ncbi:hypothetical protein NFI96_027593, partial [Prochilodus magdalenae]
MAGMCPTASGSSHISLR